jgi:pyruvate/2-oxoglutarate dehydrogenase complex dihydrolipoamide dehydrogenase (E3) component
VLPKDMLIIGSGPIGCELGQGFARLGTKVTMVEMGSNFLPREDPDCSAYLQDQMIQDGVKIIFKASILKVNKTESGRISVLIKENVK